FDFGGGFGGSVGVDSRGGGSLYANLGYGIKLGDGVSGLSLGANVGTSTNFEKSSNSIGVGVSMYDYSGDQPYSFSLLGASISTSSSKPSLSLAGFSAGVHNEKAGRIQKNTTTSGFFVPVYYFSISGGSSYTRYWSDERANIATHGALHYPSSYLSPNSLDTHAYDTYSLIDPALSLNDNANPENVLGGSFPDYDQYSVTGQGLGGNIRPYHFQKTLYRQNRKNKDGRSRVKHYAVPGSSDFKPHFRFVNDFSNKMEFSSGNFSISNSGNSVNYGFGALQSPAEGFQDNQLAGSKQVRHFTNAEIRNGTAKRKGLIDNQAAGFVRDDNAQIGAFVVTNETGVNYHYALPVYSWKEFIKSQKKDVSLGRSFNSLSKPEKYAYTWYLTAITGPDYVDRNNDGKVNEGDWGYWVGIDHGLWTREYNWRNPGIGFHEDLDKAFQNYSKGKKELYYLNTIRTNTHTAVFVKDLRPDGKGTANYESDYGYFTPISNAKHPRDVDCMLYPTSTLKLRSVYLFKNTDYNRLGNLPNTSGGLVISNTCI
ncbi:MAG: hypothetical protein AAF223_13525, partial [Bacteroidota bacterium]